MDGQILHRIIHRIVVIHKIHNPIEEVVVVEIVVQLMIVDQGHIRNHQGNRMPPKIHMIIWMSSLILNSMRCMEISFRLYLSLYSWV